MLARKLKQQEKQEEVVRRSRKALKQPIRYSLIEQRVIMNKALRRQLFALLAVIAVCASLVIFKSSQIASHGFELGKIQTETIKLEQENAQLFVDTAKLKSPQRIQEFAQDELGMTIPSTVYYSLGNNQNDY